MNPQISFWEFQFCVMNPQISRNVVMLVRHIQDDRFQFEVSSVRKIVSGFYKLQSTAVKLPNTSIRMHFQHMRASCQAQIEPVGMTVPSLHFCQDDGRSTLSRAEACKKWSGSLGLLWSLTGASLNVPRAH